MCALCGSALGLGRRGSSYRFCFCGVRRLAQWRLAGTCGAHRALWVRLPHTEDRDFSGFTLACSTARHRATELRVLLEESKKWRCEMRRVVRGRIVEGGMSGAQEHVPVPKMESELELKRRRRRTARSGPGPEYNLEGGCGRGTFVPTGSSDSNVRSGHFRHRTCSPPIRPFHTNPLQRPGQVVCEFKFGCHVTASAG